MLPDETRREILAALTELPYNVLWKWEADHLPGKPKNVYTRKWLPQQDVLGACELSYNWMIFISTVCCQLAN